MSNVGEASITAACNGGRTVITQQFGKSPLQVHRPLYLENSIHPTMYLRTPSSGLLDGDVHRLAVDVQDDSQLEVRTQASTLVYPGESAQHVSIRVGNNATLKFLPHPIILARDARFSQTIEVILENDSKLLMVDHWAAGRIAMGECWQFASYSASVRIKRDSKLVFVERWSLKPSVDQIEHPFICANFRQFRTIFQFGISDADIPNLIPGLEDCCERRTDWTMQKGQDKIKRSAFD